MRTVQLHSVTNLSSHKHQIHDLLVMYAYMKLLNMNNPWISRIGGRKWGGFDEKKQHANV